jgi:hypothetical protein
MIFERSLRSAGHTVLLPTPQYSRARVTTAPQESQLFTLLGRNHHGNGGH